MPGDSTPGEWRKCVLQVPGDSTPGEWRKTRRLGPFVDGGVVQNKLKIYIFALH